LLISQDILITFKSAHNLGKVLT